MANTRKAKKPQTKRPAKTPPVWILLLKWGNYSQNWGVFSSLDKAVEWLKKYAFMAIHMSHGTACALDEMEMEEEEAEAIFEALDQKIYSLKIIQGGVRDHYVHLVDGDGDSVIDYLFHLSRHEIDGFRRDLDEGQRGCADICRSKVAVCRTTQDDHRMHGMLVPKNPDPELPDDAFTGGSVRIREINERQETIRREIEQMRPTEINALGNVYTGEMARAINEDEPYCDLTRLYVSLFEVEFVRHLMHKRSEESKAVRPGAVDGTIDDLWKCVAEDVEQFIKNEAIEKGSITTGVWTHTLQ